MLAISFVIYLARCFNCINIIIPKKIVERYIIQDESKNPFYPRHERIMMLTGSSFCRKFT